MGIFARPNSQIPVQIPNSQRFVLGCIEAKFCKEILHTHVKALAEIYTVQSFAPLVSNLETMQSGSGKRHPGEKQSTGEERSKPQQ